MTTYVIGDVHGDEQTLLALLDALRYAPERDTLYFVGDLVNNGPSSARVLRWIMGRGEPGAQAVLGNHDLHLLAVWAGVRPRRAKDTFADVLDAPDADAMCDWLRHRPLLLHDEALGLVVVHAGLLPTWDLTQAKQAAAEVEAALRGSRAQAKALLERMYGDEPKRWQDASTLEQRQRVTINAMTRMRVLDRESGALDMAFKATLDDLHPAQVPWFRWPARSPLPALVCFGHWSALGVHREADVLGLDSGCTWGRALTAYDVQGQRLIQAPVARQG